MSQPGELAFRMIDDIYYVGIESVSSHLFTSSEGHILLDTCFPDSGPDIIQHITQLGFDPTDVKYILITHAHIDHLGSARYMAEVTGAKVCIGVDDVETAEEGRPTMRGLDPTEPFKVDVPLKEGDLISVGDKEIHVHHTPGHTPGCSSFSFKIRDNGEQYDGYLFGGPGVNVFRPEDLKRGEYGGTIEDFWNTLDRLQAMSPDVWLGAHPGQNKTFDKRDRLAQGETPNPFVDPEGWKAYITAIREKAPPPR